MKIGLIAAALTLPLAAGAAPAQAAPSPNNNMLDITRVTTTSVTIDTSCPSDPPQNVIVYEEAPTPRFLGMASITCTGARQRVTVAFSSATLAARTRVDLYVTVSGDSGEINEWGTFVVHR